MNLYVIQERIGIAKLFGLPTRRDKKPVETSQNRRVIVQETDQTWAWSMQSK